MRYKEKEKGIEKNKGEKGSLRTFLISASAFSFSSITGRLLSRRWDDRRGHPRNRRGLLLVSIGEDFREEGGKESFQAFFSLNPDLLLACVLGWADQVASICHDQKDVFQAFGDSFLLQ